VREKLKFAIERFQRASTSLEAYQAISEFVSLIKTIRKYTAYVEKEGQRISNAKVELGPDIGNEPKEYNEYRTRQAETLHQLDPMFPLRNLHHVHVAIQPENIVRESIWIFRRFGPDDPLPEADRKEYQMFLDKVYKGALPFIGSEKPKRPSKKLSYDPKESELFIKGERVRISLKHDKPNAHYVLKYIFSDSAKLSEEHFFSDMIDIAILDNLDNKDSWRKYYRACMDINENVRKQAKFDDFLKITAGKTGAAKINDIYLK